jgi:CelD/BcsL family acetyltransferase involved in cellulose biosynthesis
MPMPVRTTDIKLEVLLPGEVDRSLSQAWTTLAEQSPAYSSPFLSPKWVKAVDQAQGMARPSGIKIILAHAGGEPLGFFSARTSLFTAMPVGAPMSDYQAMILAPGIVIDPKQIVRRLGVSRFDFSHLVGGNPGFSTHSRGQNDSWIVDLPDGYDAYREGRKAEGHKILPDLDKKRRKAEREIGKLTFRAFSRSRSDLDQLVRWKRGQYFQTGQTDVLATAWTRRLLDALFEGLDPTFGGTLFTLHADDRLIAAHYHLRGAHVLHGWLIAHDHEYDRYSPGLLLFQNIMQWMDGTPYSRLDLGAGDYRFKRQLATSSQTTEFGFVGIPSAASLVRGTEYNLRQVAERLPLGQFSEIPGKAMRRLDVYRSLR